ncbi:MAG: geranylgeranyl reductase family protein [Halobacteriaceae archaeon]
MYDFAVVGVGPAGARFARRAAEAGYDVVAFEQGEIGEPLACSGHVSLDVWDFVPDSARSTLLQNEIRGARFHVGGPDSRGYPFYRDAPISNVIDRVGLDRHLADAARDAGADIRDRHSVTSVSEREDHVELVVRGPMGTESIAASMVAGCDGPGSSVREEVGLPRPDEFLHGVLGFAPGPDDQDFVDVHLTVPGFFAWRIPRGDAGVEYGLAANPGADVGTMFDTLLADYGVELDRRCSGVIPVGPPDTVTGHRTFLIGDAAGQTKPFTGGGIRYGMTAADHAVAAIDPSTPSTLAAYESAWREDLERDIQLGRWVRRAYDLPAPIQHLGLWVFAGKIGVHMDRPSSLFSWEQMRAMFSR